MAHLDRVGKRLEIKLVYWGPARGGKTTSLRSVHGSCDPAERGDLTTVDTEDERTYYFDYAPMDLPRYRDHEVRAHAFTVPGQEAYVETRRRVLRGADAVVFVADASPSRNAANLSSWRQLDDCLKTIEGVDAPKPVVVAANKQDLPGALSGEEIARRLAAAVPSRAFVDVVETTAIAGRGVLRGFRSAIVAAADSALSAAMSEGGAAARRAFLAALDARFRKSDDGVPVEEAPAARTIRVPMSSTEPDAGGLDAALEASRWLAVRDLDAKDLERERALGRLLLDVGQTCLAATDRDTLARRTLSSLVMNLDAVSGWMGLPEAHGGERVYDPMGPAAAAGVVAETARALALGVADGRTAPVGEAACAHLPGGAAGGQGLFTTFSTGAARGWLLLVGPPGRGLPRDAESILAPAGAFLGLTVSRLAALEALQAANTELERRVDERTAELRREKDSLEARVRERTKELEEAKRSTVDAERRILDRERAEGVHRLAAGLAHEVNNPIGAVRANLDFVAEGLSRLAKAGDPEARAEAEEMFAAVLDARRDADRVTASVRSLFGEAASSRRAAVRTPLAAAVRDALKAFADATPGVPAPVLVERTGVVCGVPPAECARWLFRLLTVLSAGKRPRVRIEVDRTEEGPRLDVEVDHSLSTGAHEALADLAREVSRAGGRLDATDAARSARVRLVLPVALGDSGHFPPAGAALPNAPQNARPRKVGEVAS